MRVLVSGYYGFGNSGDEALLEGLLNGLIDAGHEPEVLSGAPDATRELHGVPATHRVTGLLPALLRCQALVSGGGGLLQDATSSRSLRYYLTVIGLAKALRRRVLVYGQSVGPLSPSGCKAVGRALAGIPVAVRDRSSQELLRELGVEAALTADPALLLEPAAAAPGEGGEVVLVPRARHPEFRDSLMAVGRHFLEAGCGVVLLPLHPAEDAAETERLADTLPGATVRSNDDHREALRLIAGARLVVSVRLHGLILAAAAGTPFIGLVYQPKVAGFLAEVGATGFEAPVDSNALLQAAREPALISGTRRGDVIDRARSGIDWLDQALRGAERGAL